MTAKELLDKLNKIVPGHEDAPVWLFVEECGKLRGIGFNKEGDLCLDIEP